MNILKYFILFSLFFIVVNVQSQTFNGGILGGLSASQLDGDNWGGYHKVGVCLGVYTNRQISSLIDAQLEIRYTQKGSSSNTKKSAGVFYESNLNYIELPISIKYYVLDKLTIQCGLAPGYLQKATENKDGIGNVEASPKFDPFELSVFGGVEYRLTKQLYINARLNYSVLSVRNHPGNQTYFLNRGQYNNVLTFAFYYQINKSNDRKRKKNCDCPKWGKRRGFR